ncbi:MAG: putative bifunctional diguanylate cyclase/phosphodiesterase, partial [Desulfovibrionaceae bacterium]
NDSRGHGFGDLLLTEVSRRLLDCVRPMDTVSRFGGDEFVLFLEDIGSPSEAYRVVRAVREAMREPFVIEGETVQTSASLGVVLDTEEHSSPEELIQKANIAMYRAKEGGRDQYNVFDTPMLERAVRLLQLENDLRRAISNREFSVVYQPIVDLADGRLTGFEALARWNHPKEGPISPGEFIPVAEETGMILDIGMIIMREACLTMNGWLEEHPQAAHVTISVNLSGRQFAQDSLAEDIREILATTGLPPKNLKLEITETTIMDDVQASAVKLAELRHEGITLAIDDFGTGYSSLSYLQKLPLDHLKVDLSFVQQMQTGQDNIEIVRAIINLAHSLRLKCVAEGIETREQQGLLYSMQCEYGQGYLFSRPLLPGDVPEFMASHL